MVKYRFVPAIYSGKIIKVLLRNLRSIDVIHSPDRSTVN